MLKGTLDDFTLPDIFRLMSLSKKTGSLQVERSAGQGKVYFRDGEVYYAESSLSKEPLGQKLVRAKALTEGQLRKALDTHAGSGKRLGEVLMESGMVDEDQIMGVVRQQIEDAAFDLLRWELGEFLWEPGVETDSEVTIYVTVENLIMEASRRLDELEVIQRKIPSPDTVLAMAATPPEGAVEINITPDEWRILVLVNGMRTVREIGEMVGLDDFGAMRTLYGLVSAGLAEVPGHAGDESEEELEAEAGGEPEAEVDFPEQAEAEAEPEPEQEPSQEAEEQEEPAPEIHEEQVAEVTEVEEPTEQEEPAAEEQGEVPLAEMPLLEPEELLSEPEPTATEEQPAEETSEPVLQAVPDVADDQDVPVEEFDAPEPGDLTAEGPTPDEDALAAELLAPEAPPEEPAAEEPEAPPAPEPAADQPEAPGDIPVSSESAGESPRVDRIAAVRELAGLFSEGEEDDESNGKPRARATESPESEGAPDNRKRVEDDEQVTRGLISRLIDGVKGL